MKLIVRIAVKHEKWNHRIRFILGEWKWHNLPQNYIDMNMYRLIYDIDALEYFVVVMKFKLYDTYTIAYMYDDAVAFNLIRNRTKRNLLWSLSFRKKDLLSKYNSDRSFENNHVVIHYFKGLQICTGSIISFEKVSNSHSVLIIKK